MTIEPLRLAFEVAASQAHAFRTWTERIDRWWPASHSESGDPRLTVVLETEVGGRIYERTPNGSEHEWGAITVWEPPKQFGYSWHLRRTAAEATDVLIRFVDIGPKRTRVEIEQSSWERLGADAQTWRDRNQAGWGGLLPHYIGLVEGDPS